MFDAIRRLFAAAQRSDVQSRPRAADEAYKLAQRSRTAAKWEPANFSGDSAIAGSTSLGLARAREQVRNNPQFGRAQRMLVDLIVGQGIQAFSTPFSFEFDVSALLEDTSNEAIVAELAYAWESDQWFREWSEDPRQCDVEAKLAWPDMQRLAFSELIEVGDALFLTVQKTGRDRLIPFALQHLEREQLDRTQDRPAARGQNKIVNGIELDAENRPVAYHLFDSHPDDDRYSLTTRSQRVDANRVIHIFVPFRPSQNVGFSWFAAMAQTARDRHWLVGSELTKAAIGALLTLVHYRQRPGQGAALSLSDGESTGAAEELGNTVVKLAQGGGVTFEANIDDRVEMFNPNIHAQNLRDMVDVIDHDAAAGVSLSHLRYTGRWQGLSYTAGRGAQLDDEMHARPLKNFWGRRLVLPVRRSVNAQMVARGHVQSVSARQFERERTRLQSFFLVGPGREMLDPENETNAALAKLRSGLSTLQIENGNRGMHWIANLLQMRREMLVTRMLGLKLDYSKGQGGQTTATTTDAAAAASTGEM